MVRVVQAAVVQVLVITAWLRMPFVAEAAPVPKSSVWAVVSHSAFTHVRRMVSQLPDSQLVVEIV